MAEAVRMPRQGQSVESCIITKWLKQKGDPVQEGDLLFSYETDKAAFDESAACSGFLLEQYFQEGDEVPVLSTVAVIGAKGEDTSSFAAGTSSEQPVVVKAVADGGAKMAEASPTTTIPATGKTKISPRARKMAESLRIRFETIHGSGPMGRIIVADIEKTQAGKATTVSSPYTQHDPVKTPAMGAGGYTDEKFSNMRKIIAVNMMRSLSQSAQLTHHTSADARKILTLRREIKEGKETRLPASTTLNDMVCFAIVQSLQQLPEINSHLLGDTLRRYTEVHLGIAVDTPRGLMVPALRSAGRYNLGGLGKALRELAESCKNGTVDPDLLASDSATFTVTNLGAYGVEMFTPVLNLPQCGIMGINTIIQRPADLGDGSIGFIPHIGLSLTYDHRALDGAPASRFLQLVQQNIEHFDPQL